MADASDKTAGQSGPTCAADPFRGGGEAGAILRAIDWPSKPIGPVDTWPQSLRTALSLCLASRHPICIIWGPDRLYFYNDAYAPILGEKHPWALGESYITVWPEIWESSIRPILEQVEQTGEASWCDDLLLVLRRHGFNEECYFAFSFAPTRVEDGSVGGVFTAITETTLQVVGERRLHTLRDLGARAPDARSAEEACRIAADVLAQNRYDVPFALFYAIDETGQAAKLVPGPGIEPGARGTPARVALDQEDPEDFWHFGEVIRSGKPRVHSQLPEDLGPLPKGPWPERPHTAVVLPIARPGESVPYGLLVCGASARRPLDPDYQSFFSLIASQVATAVANALAFAEQRRRAESLAALDRAKIDFFSNVSHEFRTPLTLILGPLEELLSEPARSALPADAREQLKVVHRNSLRLLKLVNMLLDFSRLEAGRIDAHFEPVDLPEFTADLVAVFRSAIEKAGLRLQVDCPPAPFPALVDREMWEKIVFNLLSNAFKFTRHGEIEVSLHCLGPTFELRVRDTGLGIPPESQSEVFKRFHRLKHAHSRTHEGTGIGLSLVQELVRLHGGTVSLTSEVNVGTIVSVTIPVHRPAGTPANPGAPRSASGVEPRAFVEESLRWIQPTDAVMKAPAVPRADRPPLARVLLADDNADMRDYVMRLLREHYDIAAVADGQAALALVRHWKPDLVLADIMMPGLDGFELLQALRESPATQQLPVILLSARAGEESRSEGLEAGADDYLIKPFSARELLARVQSQLHLAELRRKAEAKVTASEARLAQLVAMLPAGIYTVDAEGRITFYNPRAAEIWQARPTLHAPYAEFAAQFKIIGEDGREVAMETRPMPTVLREGRNLVTNEIELERPDGSRFFANFSISPTFGPDGQISGAIAVFQDVTAERQARVALRATEERYRAVFQQASIGIMECDLEGRILRCNPALARLVGYAEAELCGMNWRDLCPPEEVGENERVAQRLLRGDRPSFTGERRYRRKDGSVGWIDIFATSIFDDSGRPTYGLAMLVDITERKRAEAELRETEERFRVAADNAPVLLWIADTDKQRTWFNQPWLEFVGRTLEQEVGLGWLDNVHPEDRDHVLEVFDTAFERRGPFRLEYRIRRHDGEYRWMLVHGVPRQQDEEFVGYIGSCVDITDRRLAEEAIHASRNAERAHRVELERARDEAVAASRAKDDFLAALSHELRTPLSPVLLLASDAAADPQLPPSVRADFETIRKSVELEARLIDDLLDLTRIVRDKISLDLREVDAPVALRDALINVRAEFEAKRIGLVLDLSPEPQFVRADPVRLQQVIWNVLKNAVKFTPAGGRVTITSRIDHERRRLVLAVADTGIGMTAGEIERAFEAFAQGDHAGSGGSHRFGGLGLGLAISRRVVELHGGSITAQSPGRGRGAVFRIELPLLAGPAGATAGDPPVAWELPTDRTTAAATGGSRRRVLLVEDHAPTRSALESLLVRRGFSVTAAASATEARALAASEHFDLLISDIGLPDGSGYDLMAEFRERYGLVGIALTGYGMEEDVMRSRRAGFKMHLTKPVRIQHLDQALATLQAAKEGE
ncbi:PAS domain S-box protein [Opitutus terrae]|uniref:histidine kinase n=1 Tax=Opitutus terrae (strain DSM 11246 / JCM 15787 / PB90-1) TaxID=452637 RepID=B1ZVG7_OPITP|nr:PAS domain S-box protein [Opitutus terrae]ACB74064.1 multi-sensor hybrid histidine kinase [Opitutus terrae PB90-1]